MDVLKRVLVDLVLEGLDAGGCALRRSRTMGLEVQGFKEATTCRSHLCMPHHAPLTSPLSGNKRSEWEEYLGSSSYTVASNQRRGVKPLDPTGDAMHTNTPSAEPPNSLN